MSTAPENDRTCRVSLTVRITDPDVLRRAALGRGLVDDLSEPYTPAEWAQFLVDDLCREEETGFEVLESEVEL